MPDVPRKVEGIVLIPKTSRRELNNRQLVAYSNHRKKLIECLLESGKNPGASEGYAVSTVKNYASIIEKFYRWGWKQHGGYTTSFSHEDAERYLEELIECDEDYSQSHLENVKLGLQAYFRWTPRMDEWECTLDLEDGSPSSPSRDLLTIEERKAIREAALEFGAVPAYSSLSPDERSDWKEYLGRRFMKPKSEITKEDWERANGFKYTSIVHTSLDAGLRPGEVGRAKTTWVDIENRALRIPQGGPEEDYWEVSLQQETTEHLTRWLEERELYEKYRDTDQLWLTRHGNPYSSSSLRYVLDQLREIAGIEREFSWFAIRHSTGAYMAREGGIKTAQSQLRHKSLKTSMKYKTSSLEDRRDALERLE